MSNHADFNAKVRQLKEMLPQHSEATIERVLREKHGVVDSALTVLLDMPPESGNSSAHHPASKPQRKNNSSTKSPSHIFPADFLRWPPNAKVVREQIGSEVSNQPQEPQFIYQPPPMPQPNIPSNQPQYGNSSKNPSAWNNFKDRFRSKDGNTYAPI